MYQSLIKPIAFQMQAEKAHYFTFDLLRFLTSLPGGKSIVKGMYGVNSIPSDAVQIAGVNFKNKVGLAAGLDKNAQWLHQLKLLGFGFIEIGTVTPKPQEGNPKPRLFRLPQDQGLINRMGFNNEGVYQVAKRLETRPSNLIVGGNIGKNKITPNDEAISDYQACFKDLQDLVDYFVVNVSSPNTPGLRELQDKEPLKAILNSIHDLNQKRSSGKKPVFLKIAPDLTIPQLDDIIALTQEAPLDGLIATNTTIGRNNLLTPEQEVKSIGAGGLSGAPVKSISNSVLKHLRKSIDKSFPIIGVGGIVSGSDAKEKVDLGADLVQVYSGMIYKGPALVKECVDALRSSN